MFYIYRIVFIYMYVRIYMINILMEIVLGYLDKVYIRLLRLEMMCGTRLPCSWTNSSAEIDRNWMNIRTSHFLDWWCLERFFCVLDMYVDLIAGYDLWYVVDFVVIAWGKNAILTPYQKQYSKVWRHNHHNHTISCSCNILKCAWEHTTI